MSDDESRWASELYEMVCEPQLLVTAQTTVTAFRMREGMVLTVVKLFEEPSRRDLSQDEWRQLQAAVKRAGFWDEPPPNYEPEMMALDGVGFSLEGRRGERHRQCHVFNPEEGPF